MDDFDPEGHHAERPDENACRDCYRWGRYFRAGTHEGYRWFRTCPSTCDHKHHTNNPDFDEGLESDVA